MSSYLLVVHGGIFSLATDKVKENEMNHYWRFPCSEASEGVKKQHALHKL
jgi:hypothetical protein